MQSQILCPANQVLCQTRSQLAEVYAALGRFADAVAQCTLLLRVLCQSYPSNSTAIAYQRLQLADLLKLSGNSTEAPRHLSEADSILKVHFGPSADVTLSKDQ